MSEAVKPVSAITLAAFIYGGVSAQEANRLYTGQLRWLCLRVDAAPRKELLTMDRYRLAELVFEHYGRKTTR